MIRRRKLLLGGLATLIAAPAVVRATSLMKITPIPVRRDILHYDIYRDVTIFSERWVYPDGTTIGIDRVAAAQDLREMKLS